MSLTAEIATIVGALIAIITYLFKAPHWSVTKEAALKSLTAILLGLGSGLGVLILGSIVSNNGTVASGHPSSRPSSTASTSNPPSASSAPKPIPLEFWKLSNGQSVAHYQEVTLTGTVPSGRHLWIFVYSSGVYYVQGRPIPQPPDFWSLAGVTFGSNAAGDINAPYTIYAVIADQQANGAIDELLKKTKGNTGTSVVPGDGGAQKVAHVTVIRTH